MNMKRIVMLILSLACLGCEKEESEIGVRLSECVNAVVKSEELGLNGYGQTEAVLDEIVALTNVERRIEGLSALADALLSARLDGHGYRQWDRSLSAIPSLTRSVCNGLLWSGARIEQVYDVRLKLLSWHRRQIDLLRRTKPPENGAPHGEAQKNWRRCQERVLASEGMTLDLLESRFDDETRTLSPGRRDAIRAKVEAFLGRPMRSAETVRKERRKRMNAHLTER